MIFSILHDGVPKRRRRLGMTSRRLWLAESRFHHGVHVFAKVATAPATDPRIFLYEFPAEWTRHAIVAYGAVASL
jgi:hypothetical protein